MYLKVTNLRKRYETTTIINKVSFILGSQERVGVMGKNGSGKSTLLQILAGILPPTSAQIVKDPPYITSLYLKQVVAEPHITIADFILDSIPVIGGMKRELEQAFTPEKLALYEEAGGYAIESHIPKALAELGLGAYNEKTYLSTLSGGEKTRLQLAPIIIAKPHILLLDEPTNHLDKDGVAWLINYLLKYKGIVIFATHDIPLLQAVATRIIGFENGKILDIHGGYDSFMQEKELQTLHSQEAYKQQVEKLSVLRKNLDVWEDASFRAEYRLGKKPKDNDKMQNNFLAERAARKFSRRAEVIKQKIDHYEKLEKPTLGWQMKLEMPVSIGKKLVFNLQSIAAGYGDLTILHDFSLDVHSDERICLTGANGSGKSTILKLLASKLEPQSGKIYRNAAVKIGYLSQDHLEISQTKTMLTDFLDDIQADEASARAYLHFFLFTGHDVYRDIGSFSLGEKAKYAFAKLLFQKPQFLLLDEPTNYMDLPSRNVIEKALRQYTGGVIVATHDKALIEAVNPGTTIHLGEK